MFFFCHDTRIFQFSKRLAFTPFTATRFMMRKESCIRMISRRVSIFCRQSMVLSDNFCYNNFNYIFFDLIFDISFSGGIYEIKSKMYGLSASETGGKDPSF